MILFVSRENGWTVRTSRNNIRHQLIRRHGNSDDVTSCGKAAKERARDAAQAEMHVSNNLFMAKGRKLTYNSSLILCISLSLSLSLLLFL